MKELPSQILIATNNRGKFSEISDLLSKIEVSPNQKIRPISAFDLAIEEPEETGITFSENALLKAKYYAEKSGLVSLADDSGLCVDALNGSPGIYSARWAIDPKTDKRDFSIAFTKIEKELKKIGINVDSKPSCHFVCSLALFDPLTGFSITFEGKAFGMLTFPPRGNKGFGYDPIFVKDGMNETFAEIDSQLKDSISHRASAFSQFLDYFRSV